VPAGHAESSTAEEALGVLGTDTTRAEHGLNALLVGVTGFFRDPHVFEALAFELARRVGGPTTVQGDERRVLERSGVVLVRHAAG
jgi:chemotaxis methyl-accepting protein methylase